MVVTGKSLKDIGDTLLKGFQIVAQELAETSQRLNQVTRAEIGSSLNIQENNMKSDIKIKGNKLS